MERFKNMQPHGWVGGRSCGTGAAMVVRVQLADERYAMVSQYAAHPAIARKSRIIVGVLCGTGLCGPDWSLDQKDGGG